MNRLVMAVLFAAAAGVTTSSLAHRGGGHGGGFHGSGFQGQAFHGHGFARPVPFRGAAGFPVHRGFFPRHHHHRSAVFVGAGFGFPAYYAYSGYYPAYRYVPAYPVYLPAEVPPGPVMRLYCPDPAGYFPEVRDCTQDWVQVPQQ
jgi:hypothetical protein